MTIERYIRGVVAEAGWWVGSTAEDQTALMLTRAGWSPRDVRQQYRVGRYRLDFAWPDIQLDLEVDGWYHHRPDLAAKDKARDQFLRGLGWIVLRVDDGPKLEEQVVRVCQVAHMLRDWLR